MPKFYLGKSREEMSSYFESGNVYEGLNYKQACLQLWGNEFLDKYAAISIWEDLYKRNIEHFIVSSNRLVACRLPLGISSEFKKIRNVEHVKKFASKYGTLGLENLKPSEISSLTGYNVSKVGIVPVEPIEFWYDCVKRIRCIIGLYEALQVAFKENSELVLDCEILTSNDIPIAHRYSWVYKDEKEETSLSIVLDPPSAEPNLNDIVEYNLNIGRKILIQAIKPFINGYIHIDEEIILNENSSLGIEIIEHKYTNILLTAIFYDLWLMLVANIPAGRCKKCNKPFVQSEKGRDKIFCSDSCRVLWNRKQKSASTYF